MQIWAQLKKPILTKTSLLLAGTAHTKQLDFVHVRLFASREGVCDVNVNRVVTRYMGSGITASGSGSWTRDPGSQVMGSGSANFFLALEGNKDRSLFRYFILYEKQEYSVLQGKRPLFRTIEKAFKGTMSRYFSIFLKS